MDKLENLDQEAIKKIIPHREPFILVDRVISATAELVVAEHTFRETDFFFKGHFPGYPVVPGVILIETMAQCGGAGIAAIVLSGTSNIFLLGTVSSAKFRQQVRPGDTARCEIVTKRVSTKLIKQAGKLYVGDTLCAEAEWTCFIVPNTRQKDALNG